MNRFDSNLQIICRLSQNLHVISKGRLLHNLHLIPEAWISLQSKEIAELIKKRSNSEKMYFFSNPSCTELKLDMAFEEHCVQEMSSPSYNRTANGSAKRAVAECISQQDLSALGSCSNSIIGSETTVTRGFEHRTSSDDIQDGCSGFLTSFRPGLSTNLEKQSGAQMTIFYGGTVYLYDNIRADKAQAIMLMASSGNNSSYLHTKLQNGCGSQTERKISFPAMKLCEGSGIDRQPISPKVHTESSDIPLARKHSLQRFLEQRQNRVNAKATCPYKTAEPDNPKPHQRPSTSLSPI